MAITKDKLIRLVNDEKKVQAVKFQTVDGISGVEYFATNRQGLAFVNRVCMAGGEARGYTVHAREVPE